MRLCSYTRTFRKLNLIIYRPWQPRVFSFSYTTVPFAVYVVSSSRRYQRTSKQLPNFGLLQTAKWPPDFFAAGKTDVPAASAKLSSFFSRVYRKLNGALMTSRRARCLWYIYGSYVPSVRDVRAHATYIRTSHCEPREGFDYFPTPSKLCARDDEVLSTAAAAAEVQNKVSGDDKRGW